MLLVSNLANATFYSHEYFIAMVVTSVAFIFCISTNLTTMLLLTVFSFLGAILSFIAFVIDLALFAHVKSRLRGLEIGVTTTLGLGKFYHSELVCYSIC